MTPKSDPIQTDTRSSTVDQDSAIPPELRRRLQSCFERGQNLAKEKDYDYAHEMFAQCATRDPSNLVYVEAMMDNLQQKYNNNKKGARIKGFGGRGPFKKAISNEDWSEVLKLGIEHLKANPWDVSTLRAMARACEAQHFNEVELRYLKNALDANPKDLDVNRHCAHSLARMGQFDQAIACWHRIEELRKGSTEAPEMISQLTLQKARHSGTVGDDIAPPAEALPTARPPKKEATRDEKQDEKPADPPHAEIRLNPRQKLEKAIHDNPVDIDNYLKLADWHTRQGHHGDAESVLTKALSASGNDLKVREQLENAQIRHARSQVLIAEKRAKENPSEEATLLAKSMKSETNRLELDVFSGRCQRYPDNLAAKYELGVRLKRAGNHKEAIKQLELAQADERVGALAMLELGECLQQLRQYQKAMECYVKAVDGIDAAEDQDHQKLALYRAGVLASGLKDQESSGKYLSSLVQLDAAYRDAKARLDKLNEIGDK